MRINNISYKNSVKFVKSALKRQHNLKALPNDIVQIFRQRGLNSIENVRAGDFGTICDGSKKMKYFWNVIGNNKAEIARVKSNGRSTNTFGIAPCYLKSSADNPISTSEVHNCSVLYFYNGETNTHFLYHLHPAYAKPELVKCAINDFMPEGFQRSIIVLGDNRWADVHAEYLSDVFRLIKELQKDASVEVFHDATRMPEVVGYKGKVYEIPNTLENIFSHRGQATFKVAEVRGDVPMGSLRKIKSVKMLQAIFSDIEHYGYDPATLKILQGLIAKRIEELNSQTISKKSFWKIFIEKISKFKFSNPFNFKFDI